MKEKTIILLFGLCFLISLLGEIYLLNASNPHAFSIIGIGIVVVLTGYLWIDSIWEYVSNIINKNKLMYEDLIKQENEKWEARYTELLKIQKATYVAVKKSDLKLQEEIKNLSDRIASLEDDMKNEAVK
ncbi:MAG: multidrug resistance efflux transporter family protein [Clostridiales bacterium]|mgnify:CR=1 FL=1|jgi:predicted PurR-regulated permease PerM|nr:multidrug resistance efflux transporter family protein [Clostridiales bacterium]